MRHLHLHFKTGKRTATLRPAGSDGQQDNLDNPQLGEVVKQSAGQPEAGFLKTQPNEPGSTETCLFDQLNEQVLTLG